MQVPKVQLLFICFLCMQLSLLVSNSHVQQGRARTLAVCSLLRYPSLVKLRLETERKSRRVAYYEKQKQKNKSFLFSHYRFYSTCGTKHVLRRLAPLTWMCLWNYNNNKTPPPTTKSVTTEHKTDNKNHVKMIGTFLLFSQWLHGLFLSVAA